MLRGFGYDVREKNGVIGLTGGGRLHACSIDVPADISSAAFFLVAASIAPGSELLLTHVGVNPTRIGVLRILELMGADLTLRNARDIGGEPVADILVRHAPLRGIDIPADLVPLAIDEFPVLFIAAACAEGRTTLRGAEELRVKESDRIASMAEGLSTLGVRNEVLDDGIVIEGGTLGGGTIRTFHDHRIAMAFAIAGLRAEEDIRILDCGHVATSFPGFDSLARGVGLKIAVRDAEE
jgi:3-phosphoshikimate 1-carboxyvinyltransferase